MTALPLAHYRHRLLLNDKLDSPPAPEAHGNRPHGPYGNDAKFDTNMVIILVALLCALICALGLNSIIRCAFRCSRRFSLESEHQTAPRVPTTGLKKSALRQIPVTVYRTGLGVASSVVVATDCPICLGEFEDGEKVRVLPRCRHGFHVGCIDTWLVSHSSCPTCRQSLLEPALPPTVPDAAANHSIEIPVLADSELG